MDLFELGTWSDEAVRITDCAARKDEIALLYDENEPAPTVTIAQSADNPADAVIVVDGAEHTVVDGAFGTLSAADVQLLASRTFARRGAPAGRAALLTRASPETAGAISCH